MINDLKIRAQNSPWMSGVELWMGNKDTRVHSVQFEKFDPASGVAHEPSFRMTRDQAQILIDDLWNCGLRPTEGTGSAGSLKATQNHLEDMRKIVFEKLGIK